jgi:hypothetical protein
MAPKHQPLRIHLIRATLLAGALASGACSQKQPNSSAGGSASQRLTPLTSPIPERAIRQTVYVPVYSSIYLGVDIRQDMVDLAATLSIRNRSPQYPMAITSVRYYDSAGRLVREYVDRPSELGPLATVEFVISRNDKAGGPGANFLVQWAGPPDIDEPLIEAVMLGQSGNAGFSFTSQGTLIKNATP